jgi:hypothetical protein
VEHGHAPEVLRLNHAEAVAFCSFLYLHSFPV